MYITILKLFNNLLTFANIVGGFQNLAGFNSLNSPCPSGTKMFNTLLLYNSLIMYLFDNLDSVAND